MASELTHEQVEDLTDRLTARSAELRDTIREELLRGNAESHARLAGQVHDVEDEALADLLVDAQFSEIDRHVEETRQIGDALRRISIGSYGECVDCGRPIGIERLYAWPTARRCIDCQTLYERTHASRGHNTL